MKIVIKFIWLLLIITGLPVCFAFLIFGSGRAMAHDFTDYATDVIHPKTKER